VIDNGRLRIAIVCDSFLPSMDGVCNVITNYYNLMSNNHDILLVVPGKKDYDYSKFNKIHTVNNLAFSKHSNYSLPLPNLDRNFNRALDDFKPDIIHVHSPFPIGKKAIK
jgi:phosphatidylinositol alpha 1,6-mannosyltransferase